MISVTRQKEVLVFTKTFFFVESKCSRFQYGALIPDTVMSSFTFCDIPATFRPRSLHDVMFCHHRSHLLIFLFASWSFIFSIWFSFGSN